ncbi:DUF4411 family protein [Oscillospiraceae bacterium 44-5]
MKNIYVIDACALIDAAQHYNMSKKSFAHIWTTFEQMIQCGELISSTEVLDELKDDDLKIWAKRHQECFLPLTKDIQLKTSEVLAQFPNLIRIRSTANSNADPFLIATAVLYGGSIVTNEKLGDMKTLDCKIPNVCQILKIPYMNLHTFLNNILE